MEIFGDVIERLKAMGYRRIGVEGASKGAELALAAAIEYSEISCVIIKTPSWFYSEGLAGGQPSGNCCWSRGGRGLPFTPYRDRKINTLKMIWEAKEYNILPVNTGKNVLPESVIPAERDSVPILMFSTKVDTIWPSAESCEKICERLEASEFPYPCRHVAFEHMSHMMLEYCGKGIKHFIKSEKEDPAPRAAMVACPAPARGVLQVMVLPHASYRVSGVGRSAGEEVVLRFLDRPV